MKMFVANVTRQNFQFMYWVPDTNMKAPRTQAIGVGTQVQISGDLTTPQIDGIVKQWEKYGMLRAEDVDKASGVVPLIYTIDRSVPLQLMHRVMEHNQLALIFKGKKIREMAAVAESVRMENALEEAGIPERLTGFEMSVEEINPDERSPTPAINETIRVDRNFQPKGAPPPARGKGAGRRKAA